MIELEDTAAAFVETFSLEGAAEGPLAGLTWAAKDIYDVAGKVTGCGNPDWAHTHGPAEAHAPAVAALLAAGGRLVGKTHTDELAYSLMGANAHFGTPLNSADPRRVPGGSSSGSVSAVAAGLADIGLGSDTGGSVRLPASFCGVFGLRTTHGRVDIAGAMALAPSFDTVGWFARDADTLARAGEAFCIAAEAKRPQNLLLPVDLWARAEPAAVLALGPRLARLQEIVAPVRPVVLAPDGIETWRETFRIHQAYEVWQVHGSWVTETAPDFGPGVRDRFAMARGITDAEFHAAAAHRERIRARLDEVLSDDDVMVLPSAPGAAPLRETPQDALDDYRSRALELLCPAGLCGMPQLSMPAGPWGDLGPEVATPGKVDRGPVGLSLVARPGFDGTLIGIAQRLGA